MDPQLLAQLPPLLQNTIKLAIDTFGQGDEIDDARVQGWIDDIANGVPVDTIAGNIRKFIITEDAISAWVDAQLGDTDTEADVEEATEALLAGTQTFQSVVAESGQPRVTFGGAGGDVTDAPGLVGGLGTVIPSGATLVQVTNPSGSDADSLFFVQYSIFGVPIAYEIGDTAALTELFPGGISDFDQFQKVAGAAWDASDTLLVGFIDEQIGASESIASQFERDLAAFGMESLPEWLREDQTALTRYIVGVNEGWSAGRIANELAKTEAFKVRFGVDTGAFAAVADALGTSDPLQVSTAFVQYESTLRTALRSIRGANTDTSDEYLGQLIATGWAPDEIVPVLEAERLLLDRPEDLAQTNEILRAFGLGEVDEDGFIDILTGKAPDEIFDALNTAAAFQAISEAGIEVDAEFLADLDVFDTTTALGDETQFSEASRSLARLLAENFGAVQTGAFDLTREDLIAASFGSVNPESGRSAAEIESVLGQLQRSFAARASGLAVPQAFLDESGGLRIRGFSSL